MSFCVVWEEWTGSLWMRRQTDPLDYEQACELYDAGCTAEENGEARNLCIQECTQLTVS